jgi:rubrerythrin
VETEPDRERRYEMEIIESRLPALYSNLAKAAEKQQNEETAGLFSALEAQYSLSESADASLEGIRKRIEADLAEQYPGVQKLAEEAGDRGILRALRWGQKVTTLQKSLIDRYLLKSEELISGSSLFVCEACGFIFLGKAVPQVCPVCKAPSGRFSKIS